MTRILLLSLAAGLGLAGCEPERGAGFTGIGATQAATSSYALDFKGIRPADAGKAQDRRAPASR